MEKENKIDVLYDENGKAIRVQMDVDIYEWLLDQAPEAKEHLALAG
jgi:hypothetical protein